VIDFDSSPRHFEGANQGYLDGHVKWKKGAGNASGSEGVDGGSGGGGGTGGDPTPMVFPNGSGTLTLAAAYAYENNCGTGATSLSTNMNAPTAVSAAGRTTNYIVITHTNTGSANPVNTITLDNDAGSPLQPDHKRLTARTAGACDDNDDTNPRFFWRFDDKGGYDETKTHKMVVTIGTKTSTFYIK